MPSGSFRVCGVVMSGWPSPGSTTAESTTAESTTRAQGAGSPAPITGSRPGRQDPDTPCGDDRERRSELDPDIEQDRADRLARRAPGRRVLTVLELLEHVDGEDEPQR